MRHQLRRSGLERVGEVGEALEAVLGDEREVLEPHAAVAAAIAGPARSRSRRRRPAGPCPVRPSDGSSCTSRPTPCPSEWKNPSTQRLAVGLGALGQLAGLLEDVAGDREQLLAGHARAQQPRTRARAPRWQRPCQATTSAAGAPPATNVRVMSAEQPEASSRGQMSMMIGTPAGSGPVPASWPVAPAAPAATMMSSAVGAPWSADTSRMRARTASAVSGSPPRCRTPSRFSAAAQQLGRGRHAGVGGGLGAPHARRSRRRSWSGAAG